MVQAGQNPSDVNKDVQSLSNQPLTNQATDYAYGSGKTTIAPEVLVTIARLITLETPGVSRMSLHPKKVNRLLKKTAGEGVDLEVKDNTVTADIYVIVNNNANMREVSRNIQFNVKRAISEMVGMQIGQINIHIEDIDYPMV